MSVRHFQNEVGNEILIDVSYIDGRVMIVMQGPDSCATNLVTKLEAENLREALNQWSDSTSIATAME